MRAGLFWITAAAMLISDASAQVTISDGVKRRTQYSFCAVRPTGGKHLTYYYSPVFPYDYETERVMTRALWPFWESSPVVGQYMQHNAPSCTKYDSQAEAEKAIAWYRSEYPSNRQVGREAIVAREQAEAARVREVEFQRKVAEETRRLGAHRAAEAERLVRLREAAQRARSKSTGCPLGPDAKVKCM